MNRLTALLAFAFSALTTLSVHAQQAVDIQMDIKGMGKNKCRIFSVLGNQNLLADSVLSDENGHISLQRQKPFPGGMYYFVFEDNSYFFFLLDKDQQFTAKTSKTAYFDDMVIEGDIDNTLYYEMLIWESDFTEKFDSLEKLQKAHAFGTPEYLRFQDLKEKLLDEKEAKIDQMLKDHPDAFFPKFKKLGQNPRLTYPLKENGDLDTTAQYWEYRKAYWDGFDFSDERLLRTPVYSNKLKTWITQLVPQDIDSIILAADWMMDQVGANPEYYKFVMNFIALEYKRSTVMGGEEIYAHMILKYLTPEKAPWATKDQIERVRTEAGYMKNSFLDATAKDLRCINTEGQYEQLYSIKAPLKIVYIYSYNCEHCREETPKLVKVYNEWKDKGLEIFALCVDHEVDEWKGFIGMHGMEGWHNVYDPRYESDYYRKYHIDITPEMYLLDEQNTIIAKDLHTEQLLEYFEAYLK